MISISWEDAKEDNKQRSESWKPTEVDSELVTGPINGKRFNGLPDQNTSRVEAEVFLVRRRRDRIVWRRRSSVLTVIMSRKMRGNAEESWEMGEQKILVDHLIKRGIDGFPCSADKGPGGHQGRSGREWHFRVPFMIISTSSRGSAFTEVSQDHLVGILGTAVEGNVTMGLDAVSTYSTFFSSITSGIVVVGYPLYRAINEEREEDRYEGAMFDGRDTGPPGLVFKHGRYLPCSRVIVFEANGILDHNQTHLICRWTRREEQHTVSQYLNSLCNVDVSPVHLSPRSYPPSAECEFFIFGYDGMEDEFRGKKDVSFSAQPLTSVANIKAIGERSFHKSMPGRQLQLYTDMPMDALDDEAARQYCTCCSEHFDAGIARPFFELGPRRETSIGFEDCRGHCALARGQNVCYITSFAF
ncbi:hypothetical protein IW262DRAFT_1302324 [Armillaria fumosa]|nr:hypothetical protein IW262DRAFT_1302324 [Armillaria fumosa]